MDVLINPTSRNEGIDGCLPNCTRLIKCSLKPITFSFQGCVTKASFHETLSWQRGYIREDRQRSERTLRSILKYSTRDLSLALRYFSSSSSIRIEDRDRERERERETGTRCTHKVSANQRVVSTFPSRRRVRKSRITLYVVYELPPERDEEAIVEAERNADAEDGRDGI